jgi:hypothetical protein
LNVEPHALTPDLLLQLLVLLDLDERLVECLPKGMHLQLVVEGLELVT